MRLSVLGTAGAVAALLATTALLSATPRAGAEPLAGPSASTAAQAAHPHAKVPQPRVPKGLPTAIEPMAQYVEDTSCDPHVRRGTRELADLLAHTYRSYGATSWTSTYPCGTDGTRSEHYDGRAIDWMVDVHNQRQHAAALSFLSWLFATDKNGNQFAMARRLGVMYVIYDNRMWGAWDGRWEDYDNCQHLKSAAYANSCHRTHMHISLSWNGAMGRTSFWTKHVPTYTDYGPCRLPYLNWAPRYTHANHSPCPSVPAAVMPKHASAAKAALVTYSGAAVRRGWSGPAVSAVQAAVGVPATGSYDDRTAKAVRRFQQRHHLGHSGAMNPPPWRRLLATQHCWH